MALGGMPVRFYIKVSLAVSVLCAYPVSAFAQSFLENLFGSTQQQAQQPQQRPKPKRTVRRANKAPIPEIPQRKSLEAVLTIIGSGRLATSTQAVEDIANVMGEISGGKLRITPVLGKSSAQNLRDLLDLTGRDMAVVDADVLEHLKQSDPALFARAAKEVTYVTPLFSNAFHIYTRAETKTIEALKGKKVSCDAVTAETLCQQLFSALKIDVQIVYDEAAVGRRKVLSGQVAAAVVGATPPLSSLTSLKPEDKLHFLAVPAEKLPASLKGSYYTAWLRHQDYPALIPAGEEVATIATRSLLVVRSGPAHDAHYRHAQKFVTLLFDNVAALRQAPRHPAWRLVNFAAEVPGWKRFPPAESWLNTHPKAGTQTASADPEHAKMQEAFKKFVKDYTKATGKNVEGPRKERLYAQFTEWWVKVKKPRR